MREIIFKYELKNKEDDEVKPEETEKETENKPTSGISNGQKRSKFPHSATKENK